MNKNSITGQPGPGPGCSRRESGRAFWLFQSLKPCRTLFFFLGLRDRFYFRNILIILSFIFV